MYYLAILFSLIFTSFISQVQIHNQVFASSGNSFSTNNFTIDFTIGECLTNYFISNNILTQGFQQSTINETSFIDELSMIPVDEHISIFPNPFLNEITIHHDFKDVLNINIFDQSGRLVHNESTEFNLSILNLSHLQAGIYQVVFTKENQNITRTPIVKLH
jgi:hypothetical protein